MNKTIRPTKYKRYSNSYTCQLNVKEIYRITGYLCDREICAFWPSKKAISNVCRFYLCAALHGVSIPTVNMQIIFVRFQHNHINIMLT